MRVLRITSIWTTFCLAGRDISDRRGSSCHAALGSPCTRPKVPGTRLWPTRLCLWWCAAWWPGDSGRRRRVGCLRRGSWWLGTGLFATGEGLCFLVVLWRTYRPGGPPARVQALFGQCAPNWSWAPRASRWWPPTSASAACNNIYSGLVRSRPYCSLTGSSPWNSSRDSSRVDSCCSPFLPSACCGCYCRQAPSSISSWSSSSRGRSAVCAYPSRTGTIPNQARACSKDSSFTPPVPSS